MIVDRETTERIGLDWLRERIAPVGAFGRARDAVRPPYAPGEEREAAAEIEGVLAASARLSIDGSARLRAALRAVPEPAAILARLRAGDPLDDVDFYELGRLADALDVLAAAWGAAGGGDGGESTDGGDAANASAPPTLRALRGLLAPGRDRAAAFYLADAFDLALAPARAALLAAEEDVQRRRDVLAAALRDETGIDAAGEEAVVLRDVYDGPLPPQVHIVRESAVYRVVSLAVDSPEREAALEALAHAEERARAALAGRITTLLPQIDGALDALGALDRLLARVAFAQAWGGCVPVLSPGRLAFADAVFPPLADALAAQGRRFSPLSLDVRGVAVLTGPNMGGKTSVLATGGFLCACAAFGVPPPAAQAACPLPDAIVWVGGEPEERAPLLSSFAAEIVRVSRALSAAGPASLVLVDEPARTTSPREGRALTIALVEALRERAVPALVATHFDGVAAVSGAIALRIGGLRDGGAIPAPIPGASPASLADALAAIDAAMDYRIERGEERGERSDALAVAAALGLDPVIVARARALYRGAGQR